MGRRSRRKAQDPAYKQYVWPVMSLSEQVEKDVMCMACKAMLRPIKIGRKRILLDPNTRYGAVGYHTAQEHRCPGADPIKVERMKP